jgi:hypothetical protein
MNDRPQKITLGEMRASGVRGLLIYCADYKCSHWIKISADQWSDDVRLRAHLVEIRQVAQRPPPCDIPSPVKRKFLLILTGA